MSYASCVLTILSISFVPTLAQGLQPVELPFSVALEPGWPVDNSVCLLEPSAWTDGDETLHWDQDPDRGFNINGTYSYGCAQRYTETTGVVVNAILYYLTGNADDVFVYVAGESTVATPGRMLDTTRASGLGGGIWKRANMPHPPAIEAYKDFWACVIIRRHPSGQYPLTLDLGPMVPWRGGYITLPSIGPTWYQLTDPPFWTDRNVNIRAVITRSGTGVEEVIGPTEPATWHRVWPTPMRIIGHVSYCALTAGDASLDIYDVAGNLVRRITDRADKPGTRMLVWDCRSDQGHQVRAGTYFYRLATAGRTATGKAVVAD
ncbi:MAG: FlgD immunoglobulin-like domain containing protein [candidate division WOR-3 bacterium]